MRALVNVLLCVSLVQVGLLAPSGLQAMEPEGPQPQDLIVERTTSFTLIYPYRFAQDVPRRKAAEVLNDAARYVEQKAPALKGFEEIHNERKIVVRIKKNLGNAAEGESLLGTCTNKSACIELCFTPNSIFDGETPEHEFAHALLRGNGIAPPRWVEEGFARYLEHRSGTCPAVRNRLVHDGALTKADIAGRKMDTHSAACGWVVVKYLHEIRGRSLDEIVLLQEQDIPEPREAFAAYIRWSVPDSFEARGEYQP